MEQILIVDGSNLLFQMFYGMPSRIINHQGKAIQGTLGFVGALLKILRMVKPQYVCVVFDGQTHNPRTEIDTDYKANRTDFSQLPEEDTPFSQLPDIFNALAYLGIPYAETQGCEADDWIAGYALRYGNTHTVTIVSQDSDFFQLITDNVRILRYRGKNTVLCEQAYIQEKLGIQPKQYAAFKSLTGDSADNIRGADKVGPKTAAWLLKEYGDLEQLLSHADTISKPSIRRSIIENTAKLRKNYQLICLSGGTPLPFELNEMECREHGVTTTEVLQAIGLKE